MLREALHKLLHKLLQTFHIGLGLLHEALELFLIELEGIRGVFIQKLFFLPLDLAQHIIQSAQGAVAIFRCEAAAEELLPRPVQIS